MAATRSEHHSKTKGDVANQYGTNIAIQRWVSWKNRRQDRNHARCSQEIPKFNRPHLV